MGAWNGGDGRSGQPITYGSGALCPSLHYSITPLPEGLQNRRRGVSIIGTVKGAAGFGGSGRGGVYKLFH